MKSLKTEIVAVGKWNGIDVTLEMLKQWADNFTALSEVIDVPLKFGHNDKQEMTDGQPAIGWVSEVALEGDKLFAKFTDLPNIVYNAIKKKLYKNVSIEALFDVEHKGIKYPTVLTAVALLGTDLPAVNTLNDLQTYMTANNLAFSRHETFSKKPLNNSGASTMTPEEQAEFSRLKAENKALASSMAENATQAAKFTADNAALKTQIETIESNQKKATFAAAKTAIEADLESLVKSSAITPAQRDKLTGDCTEESIGQITFAVATLKDANTSGGMDTSEQGRKGANDNQDMMPSDQVAAEVGKLQLSATFTYTDAVDQVLASNPKLAREYADENDVET